MSTGDKMQAWARDQLGIVDDTVRVDISDDIDVSGPYGCPTCGPEYETEYRLTLRAYDTDFKFASVEFQGVQDALESIIDWYEENRG